MKRDAEFIQSAIPLPMDDPSSDLACRVRELEFRNSELRRDNAELRQQYTDLFDNSPSACFTFDGRGRIIRANTASATLLGIKKQELINTDFSIYVAGKDLEAFNRHRKKTARTDGKQEITISLAPRGKKPFRTRLESSAVNRFSGRYTPITTIALPEQGSFPVDTSLFERLEKELIQTQRLAAAGQVASVVAHEINSPLQGISSLLFLVKSGCEGNHELKEYIAIIEKAFRDIRDKVKSLLNLKRCTKDTKGDLRINDVVGETMALMGNLLMRKRIETTLDLSPQLPSVHGSLQSLVQVMINLINNSIEAMDAEQQGFRKGGPGARSTLTITTAMEGARILLSTSDNGPGLSGSSPTELFDPFYTAKTGGTGIGLYISRKIVNDHEGTITAANSETRGARFTISLPVNRSKP